MRPQLQQPRVRRTRSRFTIEALRSALVTHGAPLLASGSVTRPGRLTLELTLVKALLASHYDGLLFRVLPVVVAKNRRRLNFPKLRNLARENGVSRELGLLLELTGKHAGDSGLVQEARALGLPAKMQTVRTLLVRNRFDRHRAEMMATETTRRWKLMMNVSEESLHDFLRKHGPEAAVV